MTATICVIKWGQWGFIWARNFIFGTGKFFTLAPECFCFLSSVPFHVFWWCSRTHLAFSSWWVWSRWTSFLHWVLSPSIPWSWYLPRSSSFGSTTLSQFYIPLPIYEFWCCNLAPSSLSSIPRSFFLPLVLSFVVSLLPSNFRSSLCIGWLNLIRFLLFRFGTWAPTCD